MNRLMGLLSLKFLDVILALVYERLPREGAGKTRIKANEAMPLKSGHSV
jgi:hypothetical protein